MDNVLQDMVERLRAIELLLRTQNELITGVLGELEQTRLCAGGDQGPRRTFFPCRSKPSDKRAGIALPPA